MHTADPATGGVPPRRGWLHALDRTIAWASEVPAALLVALEIVVLLAGVVARYVFNAPTIWSFDLTYMLYGALFMLGAAYALHKGAHIRTDFFYDNWSVRTKGMVDSISYIVFFFPSLILFLAASWSEAWYAYTINETSEQTPWRPILWPYKTVVPVTCVLLMLQGVSEVIKSVYAWRMGVVLEHKEKIEI